MARLRKTQQEPLQLLAKNLNDTWDKINSNVDPDVSISNESIAFISQGKSASNVAVNELEKIREKFADLFVTGDNTGMTASNESLTLEARALGFNAKSIPAAALDALAIMATALKDPTAYKKAAFSTTVSNEDNVTVIEPSELAEYGYRTEISNEAFDNRNIENLRGFNLMVAFSAAIQDEANEAAFRTVTLTPDTAGLELSIRRTMIQQEIRHPTTGVFVDWKQRNLLDAFTDPTILIQTATIIYPRVLVGNPASEANFVDKTKVAPVSSLANGGEPIMTAPLKAGLKISLIGVGQNDNTGGTPDQTDSLDSAINVEKAYFRIKTTSGESVIAFNTKGLARNNFTKGNHDGSTLPPFRQRSGSRAQV